MTPGVRLPTTASPSPVNEIFSKAGIVQGVEPSAVSALCDQMQRVDFPRGHTVFAQGEVGDKLYVIIAAR